MIETLLKTANWSTASLDGFSSTMATLTANQDGIGPVGDTRNGCMSIAANEDIPSVTIGYTFSPGYHYRLLYEYYINGDPAWVTQTVNLYANSSSVSVSVGIPDGTITFWRNFRIYQIVPELDAIISGMADLIIAGNTFFTAANTFTDRYEGNPMPEGVSPYCRIYHVDTTREPITMGKTSRRYQNTSTIQIELYCTKGLPATARERLNLLAYEITKQVTGTRTLNDNAYYSELTGYEDQYSEAEDRIYAERTLTFEVQWQEVINN